MPYIHFTEDQKLRANNVDLTEFLRRQGEKLLPSGREKRLASDHSITVRGSRWYDHAVKRGGGAVSFVQNFYNLSYPEAVTRLLGGEQGRAYEPAKKPVLEEPKKPFALPIASREMRRMYAYLLQQRLIDREIVNHFVRAKLLYESCEPSKDGTKEYHNAVFVGNDEHGVARHAHKRGLYTLGESFKRNVEGCNPRYSFHHTGPGDRLYVFEAPVDLLSFLTLHPRGWQEFSYAALCGTSEHAMLWMLEQNPQIRKIGLCLDHDEAGIEAAGRLTELLREKGYSQIQSFRPVQKDWNEALKARNGLPAQEAEEHPQLIAAGPVCGRIQNFYAAAKADRADRQLPGLIQQYRYQMKWGRFDKAMDCMEQASALALAAAGRELRQLGREASPEQMMERLKALIQPHQNRSSLQNRGSEIALELQRILAASASPGIRTQAEKEGFAQSWLELAADCAKVPIKYDAERLKLEQEQEESMEIKMEG